MKEFYMDKPIVSDFAKRFDNISNVLTDVSNSLQVALTLLKTTAFVGLVGGNAVAHFIEQVKPSIDEMAEKCIEISQELAKAVDAFERGDKLGTTRFYR